MCLQETCRAAKGRLRREYNKAGITHIALSFFSEILFYFITSICAKRFKAAHSQNGVTDCVVENIRILRIGKIVYRSVLVNAENFCGFNNGRIIRYTAFQLPVYLLFVQRRLYFASLWYLRLQKRLRLCFQIRLYSQSFACCVLVPHIYRILSILPGKFSVLYRAFLHMHKRTDA